VRERGGRGDERGHRVDMANRMRDGTSASSSSAVWTSSGGVVVEKVVHWGLNNNFVQGRIDEGRKKIPRQLSPED
jgi:hypothetical protein